MIDVGFLITTYNRQDSCQRLVDSLQGMGDIVVYNDGSDYDINGCTQFKYHRHRGKEGYWKTVRSLFNIRGEHKYYIMLPDDFLPVDDMVDRAWEIWSHINDSKKICLNLYADRQGESCWTDFKPVSRGDVWLTQWVDMCFFAPSEFFTWVKRIGGIPISYKRQSASSGVGAYISRGLYKQHRNMYQVKEGLVIPQEAHGISQMHVPCLRHK